MNSFRNRPMKKIVIAVLTIVLVTVMILAYGVGTLYFTSYNLEETNDLKEIGAYRQGTLYRTTGNTGQFYVVNLHGTFHEMGNQYGYLLKEDLSDFYRASHQRMVDWLSTVNLTAADITAASDVYYETQPSYAKELIEGLSETSGLTLVEQKELAAMPGLLASGFPGRCSSMDAWGTYSTDGKMVVGRNWDMISGVYEGFEKYLTVIVYNPKDYANSVAEINYIGSVLLQSGLNSHGIFLDLQDGTKSDAGTQRNNTPGPYSLFTFLLNATTLPQVDAFFKATPTDSGLIINAADSKTANVYEWASFGLRTRTSSSGLLASSNHFLDPTWPKPQSIPDGLHGAFSKDRYANLMALGESLKGSINATEMMRVFDTSILEGGPSFPLGGILETYYQIVAVPGDLTLWLKAPGYSGWEQIGLKPLFAGR